MKQAYIHGIGIAAPGLPDWPNARAVLGGDRTYTEEPLPPFRTQRLPRNESRRAGAGVNLAFRVAEQASGDHDASRFAAVFAASAGDIDIAAWICNEVNTTQPAVSPIRFHNSVHNAAAGYWSIATQSREPTVSLSGGRGNFVAALCEAWGVLADLGQPTLLVCYDLDGNGLLHQARTPIGGTFAMAWLLDVRAHGAHARLSQPELCAEPETRMENDALESLRALNPSAHSLPLLAALAGQSDAAPVIESAQGNQRVPLELL